MHELANVLGGILLASRSLLMDPNLDPEVKIDIEEILRRSLDGKALIEELRSHPFV